MAFESSYLLEFWTVMTFTVMGIPRAALFERVAASADNQSPVDHCRHLGIEVYPDYRAGRVAVGDRFAQRPSMLQDPRSAVSEILSNRAFRNPMIANARFKL